MTKIEIIEATLQAMRSDHGLLAPEDSDDGNSDEYEALVIATLTERLPDSDFQTCKDFRHLGASCCESCHVHYAHYDMYLEDLSDGSKAWLCCAVRSALLRELNPREDDVREKIVFEAALGQSPSYRTHDEDD